MPTNPGISEVVDKNGVTADIEAKRFDGTRTVNIQGDVTATQTWNGDSNTALTLNASIGAKKVTQDKIGDKAVGSGQMADGSVGLTQMDPNAMTSSATSGDTRLITAGGVRTEIDNAILNRGKDYGPMTPTQINAISETIPTGSTVHVTAAGTITDGDIEVRQGEDLKYYRSGNTHYWYSMDGDFKLKQQAKTSPTASGDALSFIDSVTQDENGEIFATKKTVQDGTTSQKGVVQLEDSHSSTSTTKAATPNSVKSAYDLANTANTGLADKLDKTGDGKDVTVSFSEASSRANIGTGEKLSVMFGKIKKWFTDLKALAFKDTVSDSDISGTISDNHIASASTWNGKADKVSSATNGNLAALDSNGNLTDSGKKASDFELVTNKVTSWQGTPDDTHYPSEKLVKEGLDEKAAANNAVIVSNSIIYTASGNTRSYYKVAEIDVLQNYTSAILSCDYLVAPSNDHGERGTLDLNFSVKADNSWGLQDFYARQEYSTVVSNYGLQFIVIATKNTTGTHIDLYVSLACALTGFELSRRFRKSGGSTLGDEWTFVATPTASSTAPTVPEGAVSSTITPEIRDVVMLTSADNIDNINNNTYAPKNFILNSIDWPAGTFPTGVSSTNCYLQCFGHANRQNQVLYVEINGVQNIYIRKSYGGSSTNLIWRAWQSERDASWINSGVFNATQIPVSLPNVTAGSATTATNYASGGGIANALAGKQDSLSFMNDSEAVAIWNDAKTAAANAS